VFGLTYENLLGPGKDPRRSFSCACGQDSCLAVQLPARQHPNSPVLPAAFLCVRVVRPYLDHGVASKMRYEHELCLLFS